VGSSPTKKKIKTMDPTKRVDHHIIDLITAIEANGLTMTQSLIWIFLSQETGGANISQVARAIKRDRRTVRVGITDCLAAGFFTRKANKYSLTPKGLDKRLQLIDKSINALSAQCLADIELISVTPYLTESKKLPL
jgi:DNA-binding MarR family transcriptional regulator